MLPMSISDTLYAFTEYLRTTPLNDFSIWISSRPLSMSMGSHFWVIPIIQTLHILAISAAFGSVFMINLRILGLAGRTRSMAQTVRRYQPWIWWALLVLILTGIGMITAEPVRELVNPIFWIKMVLVVAAILLSFGFHLWARRNMPSWETTHDGRLTIRVGAVAIILLWCAIMVAGRWIAYAPV